MSDPHLYVMYVLEITEHERGWGQRPDGYVVFLSEAAATAYINRKYKGRTGPAPDTYETYDAIGYKECSKEFQHRFKITSCESMHIKSLSELKT